MDDLSDDGEIAFAATGRRLRMRTTQINYAVDDIDDELEDDGRGSHAKNRGCKRKAEVNLESLYRQDNFKVSSTPLETIYESPCYSQVRKRSGTGRHTRVSIEDRLTIDDSICDAGVSLMTRRKTKRLCLFASHYYPPKQKTRFRKERARKMKQLKGVKIPKGTDISVEDLEAVLACLSEDEDDQIKNNQNVSNSKFSSFINNSEFYEGNIIRPDTSDAAIEDITHNMDALKVNKSEVLSGIQSSVEETVVTLKYDELLPLPILDEPLQSSSQNSHEKKSRRRSGRLSGRLLQPVEKTSKDIACGMQDVTEEVSFDLKCCIVGNPSTKSKLASTDESTWISSRPEESFKSCVTVEKQSSLAEPKQLETSTLKATKTRQRKSNIINREKEDKKCSELANKQRTVAKEMAKERKPQNEEGKKIKKVKKLEMGIKRCSKSEVNNEIKKRRENKSYGVKVVRTGNRNEIEFNSNTTTLNKGERLSPKAISEIIALPLDNLSNTDILKSTEKVAVKPSRGCNRHGKNTQGKQGVSEVQKSLNHHNVKPTSFLAISVNDTSNTCLDQMKDTEVNPSTYVKPSMQLCSLAKVAEGDEMICASFTGTLPSDGGGVCCHSPTSPSTRMAALTLQTDKSSSPSSVNNNQSPIVLKNRKARRRSIRLSIESVKDVKLESNPELSLGSRWSPFSPVCRSRKTVPVGLDISVAAPAVENNSTPNYPQNITKYESPFTDAPIISTVSSNVSESQENLMTASNSKLCSGDVCPPNSESSHREFILPKCSSEGSGWDSPIISGMFESKVGVRLEKVFWNKDLSCSSAFQSQKVRPQACEPQEL